ncbi:hypothetical protein RclHR1_09630001 [Rhizophagus clarus]|uniref:Uncharacterized protein n=1 Tax=Rhizophagus clarus TaxID=94130 RepID=A0A2Z6SQI8_9GLOM|nr:hypothetical protein RclHR1_09630001 [Rhizophagus clarus]
MTSEDSPLPPHAFDLYLVDTSTSLIGAWKKELQKLSEKISPTNLTKCLKVQIHNELFQSLLKTKEIDCIVSPANSFGLMDGGLDYDLSEYYGGVEKLIPVVQKEIEKEWGGEQNVGTCILVDLRNLIKQLPTKENYPVYLAHCPTMRTPKALDPGDDIVYRCTWALLTRIRNHNARILENNSVFGKHQRINSVVCAGFGTGVGGYPEITCAKQMMLAIKNFIEAPANNETKEQNDKSEGWGSNWLLQWSYARRIEIDYILNMSSSEDQSIKQEQISSKHSKEAVAYKFWQEFQEERKDIQNSIKDLSTKSKSLIAKLCEEILVRINLLEKKATDAMIYLPGYDQRQSILQIRALVEELNTKKVELTPKSKFSFKSRKSNAIGGNGERVTETEDKKQSNITTALPTTTKAITSEIITNENFQVITLNNKQNSYLTIDSYLSSPSSTDDSTKIMDFHLSSLQNCFINLVSKSVTIGAIHIKGLKNCVLLAGPVYSSILIYDCENCVFVVACHQFRMHTSKQMNIYLHVTSHPIIEDCDKIKFAPYTLSIPGLDKMFEAAKLDQKTNKYDTVEDFNWLRQQASPHWNLLEEKYLRKDWPLININNGVKPVNEDELNNVLSEILK